MIKGIKGNLNEIKRILVLQKSGYRSIREGDRMLGYVAGEIVRTAKKSLWENNIGLEKILYDRAKQLKGIIYVHIKNEKKIYRIDISLDTPRLKQLGCDMIYNFGVSDLQKFDLKDFL